ncbi:hypothetical protein [Escherichia coli]|uniref:hypothetical protein n=1 Tax=Escherichia coli TaxID=562 RepID=UPI000AE9DD45
MNGRVPEALTDPHHLPVVAVLPAFSLDTGRKLTAKNADISGSVNANSRDAQQRHD